MGEFGRYQQILCCLLALEHIISAFNNLNVAYTADSPDHWCSVPELEHFNLTTEQVKNITIPLEKKYGDWEYSQCQMYNHNYSLWTSKDDITYPNDTTDVVNCRQGWTYDTSDFKRTVVTEVSTPTPTTVVNSSCPCYILLSSSSSPLHVTVPLLKLSLLHVSMIYCPSTLHCSMIFIQLSWSMLLTLYSSGYVVNSSCSYYTLLSLSQFDI